MVEPQPENFSDLPDTASPEAAVPHVVHVNPPPAQVDGEGSARSAAHFQQSLRPVVRGIEAMARAQTEHTEALDRVQKALSSHAGVPKILADAKAALEQRNVVNRAMFEALHSELKTYKDAFLLEAVLRPVIRDLISLYDDISEIHRQLGLALAGQEQRGGMTGPALMFFETVAAPTKQLEHNRDAILEVLERLDVTLVSSGAGKLDKQSQRAVTVEYTDDPEQDQEIVKVTKRGFLWKERVIRAEEVVIKKWRDTSLSAAAKKQPKP